MTRHPVASALTLLFLFVTPPNPSRAVDPEDLRRGLVLTVRDAAREVTSLEPVVALRWLPGEAPHPRLDAPGVTARWQGYVSVLRAGNYRFSATLRGRFRLTVNDREVFAAEVNGAEAEARAGAEVRLDEGVLPLAAEFTRLPGKARVELWWEAPFLPREPLPFDALGHLPNQFPARRALDQELERGRFLVEENNCLRCHRPGAGDRLASGLASRQGPDLTQVGGRARAAWLMRWLGNPHGVRPGAVMPQLFADDATGLRERYAVALYLATLGGPFREDLRVPNDNDLRVSIARGKQAFATVGCAVCHDAGLALPHLGDKTTPEKLAAYLNNPLAVDPSGRMPHVPLQGSEAIDLARFLCASKSPGAAPELPEPPGKEKEQLLDLGKRLVVARGCTHCHTVSPGGKPLPTEAARTSWDDLKKKEDPAGCLAEGPDRQGGAPRFPFRDGDRAAVRRFLREGAGGAGAPAPSYAARATLQRFQCLRCHARDGAGGLTPDQVEELRRYEKAEHAEAVSPPPLTGVGHKLRTAWLRQVLAQGGRARPWMGLRMPQFGAANVGHLPEALAALEGAEPDDAIRQVTMTPANVGAGRRLVGKSAFGCNSCHDLAGQPNSGTRGPDLALMTTRVRYDWYRRWLEQAQRMQPGTRMPTVFTDGKSTLPGVLGGRADAQAEAMWAYLSLGMNLPLPEGVEPPRGLVLAVQERPILLRTFLAEAGNRAITVGYPGGVAVAFDAAACRLAYAWSGNFLDAAPVWNNRGGNPARPLGPRFWTAPPGHPWAVTTSRAAPDFTTVARDPAYGGPVPDGNVYDGPHQLRFLGHATDPQGRPVFRYQVNAGAEQPAEISEKPEPLRSAVATGLARGFKVRLPARHAAWLHAGETRRDPRVLDRQGQPVPAELHPEGTTLPAAGRLLVLAQEGGRVTVLDPAQAPEGTRWELRRENGTWHAVLALPAAEETGEVEVRLNVWVPFRDDPAFLKELTAAAPPRSNQP